jgi:hypothetical protein
VSQPTYNRMGVNYSDFRRPEMLLDPEVRRASSIWHRISPEVAERGLARLRADLESGRWDEKYVHLRTQPELDIGLRLVCEEL